MLKLGEIQELIIVKKVEFGVYLAESEDSEEKVLLPRKQVPELSAAGDHIEVFLYRDSQDRLIATTNQPYLTLCGTAVLEVKDVSKIGAFLDWGLEKDLFLPFKEQTYRPKKGEKVLAALYKDKSERLCATMKVYHYLKNHSGYVAGDEAKAFVYEISDRYGAYAAVDNKYSGLIQKKDMQGDIRPGQILNVRVTNVREDGRLDLAARKKAYLQMEPDSQLILERLKEYHGALPFDDRADPEVIKKEFSISKAAFKRAVGHMLKEKLVEIKDGKICLLK